MFMEIAIGAIGIGVVLMVGYLIVSQVRLALPSASTVQASNPCYAKKLSDAVYCNVSTIDTDGITLTGPLTDNTSRMVSGANTGYTTGTTSVQATVFAGFALVAVGIIVLAAFGLISIFK